MFTYRLSLMLPLLFLPATIGHAGTGDVGLPDKAPIPLFRVQADPPVKTTMPLEEKSPPALPGDEKACRRDLQRLGVSFSDAEAVEVEGGCSLPHPIHVTALGPAMALHPTGVMNCPTARAAAQLVQRAGQKAAETHFKSRIEAVNHASAYICRVRRGTENLSQHAFGNALDIASLTLADGRRVVVREYEDADSPEAQFLDALRAAACGLFTTVLGPGTDADHADHFHLDMKRRRGGAYCR
ncbi:extensin family protein [Nitratireductor luteus]|uniref:extensin-like domain-containing protein n=1 Tax=Nitratireductor luteus TaxID=2976980 RepID=UPI00224089FE|nr:extensin family protein [Nitratireductor luteus]